MGCNTCIFLLVQFVYSYERVGIAAKRHANKQMMGLTWLHPHDTSYTSMWWPRWSPAPQRGTQQHGTWTCSQNWLGGSFFRYESLDATLNINCDLTLSAHTTCIRGPKGRIAVQLPTGTICQDRQPMPSMMDHQTSKHGVKLLMEKILHHLIYPLFWWFSKLGFSKGGAGFCPSTEPFTRKWNPRSGYGIPVNIPHIAY